MRPLSIYQPPQTCCVHSVLGKRIRGRGIVEEKLCWSTQARRCRQRLALQQSSLRHHGTRRLRSGLQAQLESQTEEQSVGEAQDNAEIRTDDTEDLTSEDEDPSWSEAQHILLVEDFYEGSRELKAHYSSRFADPLQKSGDRFVWDYWHVPGQYTLMRTPAQSFFSDQAYTELIDALQTFGEQRLGCRGVSPVWLSYYVDGCRQEFHTDSPHGPWAFVLSLTDWENRSFSGGETMLLQPHVLDYWRSFDGSKGVETPNLITYIEPKFGRLTVFDPRFPHGVRQVEGNRDPRNARIVLHGWFTSPTPFLEGPVQGEEAEQALNDALGPLFQELSTLPMATGTVTVRATVSGKSGLVEDMTILTNTLMPRPSEFEPAVVRQEILGTIWRHLENAKFPTSDAGDTEVTIPFEFQ